MQEEAEAFRRAAEAYCRWAEAEAATEQEEAQTAVRLLASLLHEIHGVPAGQAEDLPEHDILLKGESTRAIYKRFGALPFQYYFDVFHPTHVPPEQADAGDLADDLMDIYVDLKQGLAYASAGHVSHAVFHWQFMFGVHWGRHAVCALRALHCHLTDPAPVGEHP